MASSTSSSRRLGGVIDGLPSFGTVSDGLVALHAAARSQSPMSSSDGGGGGVPQSTRDWLGHAQVYSSDAMDAYEPTTLVSEYSTSPPRKKGLGRAASERIRRVPSGGSSKTSPMAIPSSITNHPLFAHHAPPSGSSITDYDGGAAPILARTESFFSDPGVVYATSQSSPQQIHSAPNRSPIDHDLEDSDELGDDSLPMSPASAFLSAFSQSRRPSQISPQLPAFRVVSGSKPENQLVGLSSISPAAGAGSGIGSLGSALGSLPAAPSLASSVADDIAGTVILNYTLGKVVGRGGFSTVRLATRVDCGETFACRIVKRDDLSDTSGSLENFEKELALWESLPAHPRILPLLEMHRTQQATYLIAPYLSGGSLLDVVRRDKGSEATARKYFPGVVEAVRALHEGYPGFDEGGMLHGDLKLDNFLVGGDGSVVLCDFGLAQKLNSPGCERVDVLVEGIRRDDHDMARTKRSTSRSRSKSRPRQSPFSSTSAVPTLHNPRPHLAGIHHHDPSPHRTPHLHGRHQSSTPTKTFPSASLPYAPPELLSSAPSGPSLAQDMWALGVILHALLTSRLPFTDAFDPRLTLKIIRGDYVMPDVGREWQECLRGCLDGDKRRRWTIRRLVESDALTGWTSVKPRSKSRSRSRKPGEGGRARSLQRTGNFTDERGRRGWAGDGNESLSPNARRKEMPPPLNITIANSAHALPVAPSTARASRSRSSGRSDSETRRRFDHEGNSSSSSPHLPPQPLTPEHRGRHRGREYGPPHAPSAAYSVSHDRSEPVVLEEDGTVREPEVVDMTMRFERSLSSSRKEGVVPSPKRTGSRNRYEEAQENGDRDVSSGGSGLTVKPNHQSRSRSRGRRVDIRPL